MNTTTIEGQGRDVAGNVKEIAGTVTGDQSLKAEGIADQIVGKAQQGLGAAKDALNGNGQLVDKARTFAKERPWAAAALAGVVGMAILNTLRGKR